MARAVWNATTSLDLLNVAVQVFSGERSVDLHSPMLDRRDKKLIRYERVNSDTGEEVASLPPLRRARAMAGDSAN
jgi:DNA end-binding protein Ku